MREKNLKRNQEITDLKAKRNLEIKDLKARGNQEIKDNFYKLDK